MTEELKSILESLNEIKEDSTISKNIREKLQNVINNLNKDDEISLRIDKALNELESISDDNNIQTYTRTQIWNIVSMLEMIK